MYCRVSLDRNGERLGVETQERECREWADQHGWTISEVYAADNDISAHSGKHRADWERLLADLAAGKFDGLLGQHLDRLLRRVVDLERLIKALEASPTPVQVAFKRSGDIDLSSGSGRLVARILASVGQNESDQKSDRVKSARRREAEAGEAHTFLGYGYNDDQTINPAERQIVLEVKDRLLAGQSLLSICRDFNLRGVPTPAANKWTSRHVDRAHRVDTTPESMKRVIEVLWEPRPIPPGQAARLFNNAGGRDQGVQWTADRVRSWEGQEARWLLQPDGRDSSQTARILIKAGVPTERMYWRAANLRAMIRRGSLCGWREFSPGKRGGFGELFTRGTWTPILTKEETEAIRRITDQTVPVKGGRAAKHLLTGILRCGRCGSKMGGHLDKRTDSVRYQCSQQPGLPDRCGKTAIVAAPVELVVTENVLTLLADSGFRRTLRTRRDTTEPTQAEAAAAEVELDELRNELEQAFHLLKARKMTPADYADYRESHEQRIKAVETKLGAYNPIVRTTLESVPTERGLLDVWWDEATLERKRDVLQVLVEKVEIAPVIKRSNSFNPDRVGRVKFRV